MQKLVIFENEHTGTVNKWIWKFLLYNKAIGLYFHPIVYLKQVLYLIKEFACDFWKLGARFDIYLHEFTSNQESNFAW